MAGVYERKKSSAAIWCQRFAVFLLPFFILVILLHRFNKIETPQLFSLIAIGFAAAILALVFSLRAGADLWYKGHKGGKATVRGMFLAILVLLPFGYHAYLALSLPLANDIATDTFNPPAYVSASEVRTKNRDSGMNQIRDYTDEYADSIVLAYPELQSRRYPAGPERVLEAVKLILLDNEWQITGSSGIPETGDQGETELEDNVQNDDGNVLEGAVAAPDDIYVETIVYSLVFAFESDVVIRIISEDENTLIDVRSSSRWGAHDFGYNAKLINKFMMQLDTALLGIAGEG